MSPDMVSEVKVLTSNYASQFGASTSGQIMAVTKSGGSSFHGAAFEYHCDDSLSATQWGNSDKATFNRDNFGANIGGPAKMPGFGTIGGRAISFSTSKATGRKGDRVLVSSISRPRTTQFPGSSVEAFSPGESHEAYAMRWPSGEKTGEK